ncbi:hypothetical protein HNR42_002940 [Deinobacterium chartae]|uniref:Uncharacterized protein n=1 Tax=Deinobacterium chartae TaxID=521158 RepID=A0A841I4Y9_9DEIO|nr:hypothetical protein [Deinobacterium chartae]
MLKLFGFMQSQPLEVAAFRRTGGNQALGLLWFIRVFAEQGTHPCS